MFGLFNKKKEEKQTTTHGFFYEKLPNDAKKLIEESFNRGLIPTIEMLQNRIGRTLDLKDPKDVHLLFKDMLLLKRGLALDAENHEDKQGFVLYTAGYEYAVLKYIGFMKALHAEPNVEGVLPDDKGAREVLDAAKMSGEYTYDFV